jgi:precorrin-8X/cobalt-precorrin-8 methylmutase
MLMSQRARDIEAKSFEIIDQEVGPHPYTPREWAVVRRAIHASADFDFAGSQRIIFHSQAIEAGTHALRVGKTVIADVDMVKVGISQSKLQSFGGTVKCFISDPEVIQRANDLNTTRAIISMRVAIPDMEGGIVVNGNAPTALLEVVRLVREGIVRPALIVGIPVGFVSAVEAKEELLTLDVPYITNRGRKGGSSVAIAIVNALLDMAQKG